MDGMRRLGWPSPGPPNHPSLTHIYPSTTTRSFGWLFPAQQILLGHVLTGRTRVVVQLGAYLGKTTLFIAEQAPKVQKGLIHSTSTG